MKSTSSALECPATDDQNAERQALLEFRHASVGTSFFDTVFSIANAPARTAVGCYSGHDSCEVGSVAIDAHGATRLPAPFAFGHEPSETVSFCETVSATMPLGERTPAGQAAGLRPRCHRTREPSRVRYSCKCAATGATDIGLRAGERRQLCLRIRETGSGQIMELRIERVGKRYGGDKWALREFSLKMG